MLWTKALIPKNFKLTLPAWKKSTGNCPEAIMKELWLSIKIASDSSQRFFSMALNGFVFVPPRGRRPDTYTLQPDVDTEDRIDLYSSRKVF